MFNQPRKISAANFAGSESCKECHEKEYDLWMGSHHQLAMQLADSTSVLGDFNDRYFESKGVKYHFFREGNRFMVNTEGEGGNYKNYTIKYTFGFTPLQQYIIEFDKGNHQCLLVAWDSDSLKWFDLQPNLQIHHSEWMHWTGGSMTWNNMCADCHSTYLQKNYDPGTESYSTDFTEISVGCEACHGPSDLHNAYYKNEHRYKAIGVLPPKLYMPNNMSSTELVQKCARCHSRRSMVTAVFDYQGHFLDHYSPSLMRYPTYELDGQILDEDYVYGSFMQSKMYHNKISCRDCHDMHSMKLKKEGNDLCLQCHLPKYKEFEHHYHKMDTEASQCINCHMRGRYYMGNDFRHDHSFRNPRPDQSIKYGTPNACIACHDDKSDQWATEFIRTKYGNKRPLHFSDWLLPGLAGNLDSMRQLVRRDTFPEIMRATAVNVLAEQIQTQDDVNFMADLLQDSSALIRREAVNGLSNFGIDLSALIEPLLKDPVRIVRIVAARYFILNKFETQNEDFKQAKEDYLNDLTVNSDFASGQHQWALYCQALGDVAATKMAYRKALEIDNYYNLSRMNLALMEYESGRVEEAETLYLKVTQQEPDYSYPYYMLGLLYHEQGSAEKSLEFFDLACQKQPFIQRAFYNYALKLHEQDKYKEAEAILDKALETAVKDESLLYIKTLGQIAMKKFDSALITLDLLLQISPGNQTYAQLRYDIEKQRWKFYE